LSLILAASVSDNPLDVEVSSILFRLSFDPSSAESNELVLPKLLFSELLLLLLLPFVEEFKLFTSFFSVGFFPVFDDDDDEDPFLSSYPFFVSSNDFIVIL